MAKVRCFWDLSGSLPVPVPGWLVCPICSSGDLLLREYRIGRRNEPRGAELRRLPYRCDVSIKCLDCSAVWLHGIPLDEATGHRINPTADSVKVVHWREAAR